MAVVPIEQPESAGFVLVGGESRRMPRDKALLMSMAESSKAQLIVPVSERGYELAAVFRRDCLPPLGNFRLETLNGCAT
jgi:hypothetical protein